MGGSKKSNNDAAAAKERARQAQEMRDRADAQARAFALQKVESGRDIYKAEQERAIAAEEQAKKSMAAAQSQAAQSAALSNQQSLPNMQPNAITNPALNMSPQPIGAKQQAAISAGYVPATNIGQSAALAAALNEQSGGTNTPVNRFIAPNTQGIQFGGA